MKSSTRIILIAIAVFTTMLVGSSAAMADLDAVQNACVVIENTFYESGNEVVSSGSGFIVTDNGYIVTNAHVLHTPSNISVELMVGDHTQKVSASCYYYDEELDIAILKVGLAGLPYLDFGDCDDLGLGADLYAFGSPLIFTNILTDGVYSGYNEELRMIQHTATLAPGNSGGPLVSADGLVVGVNAMYVSFEDLDAQYYFAIPGNIVNMALLSVLDDPIPLLDVENSGEEIFVGPGIQTEELSPSYMQEYVAGYPDGFVEINMPDGASFKIPEFYIFEPADSSDFYTTGDGGTFYYDNPSDQYESAVPMCNITADTSGSLSYHDFKRKTVEAAGFRLSSGGQLNSWLSSIECDAYLFGAANSQNYDGQFHSFIFFRSGDKDTYYCLEFVYDGSLPKEQREDIASHLLVKIVFTFRFG